MALCSRGKKSNLKTVIGYSKMSTVEANKTIALFMGYFCHENVYVQDWGRFRGEPDPISRKTTVFSKHETLAYEACDAPSHWNLPDVIDGYKTEFVEELLFHSSWDWLMPVIRKINGLGKEYSLAIFKNYVSCTVEKGGKFYKDFSYSHAEYITAEQDDITAVFKLVVHFVEWYNEHIKSSKNRMNSKLTMPTGTRLKCKADRLTTTGVETGKEYTFVEYDKRNVPVNDYSATMTWYPSRPIWTPEAYEAIQEKFMMVKLEGVEESQWLKDFEVV